MRLLVLALLGLAACTKSPAGSPPPPSLLGEVKQALAERERRLASYHLVADTTEGGRTAHHEFFFRAPNHGHGVATGGPESVEVAFDGTTLYRVNDAEKKVEAYALELPPAKAALLLATFFRPFAPDGFRTPLLPSKGVTAKLVSHPMGPQAAELTVSTQDEDGPVEVTYVLRFPSGDFLGRRSRTGRHVGEVKVDTERCEAALKLCVPTKLTETRDGEVLGTTTITSLELNPELPADRFRLAPPEGYTLARKVMKED
ncbi:MAG: hypothetical protein IT380_28855 [Myxococcales bacterium]|nr:hypothetical protein [Myxococcales bacterium]